MLATWERALMGTYKAPAGYDQCLFVGAEGIGIKPERLAAMRDGSANPEMYEGGLSAFCLSKFGVPKDFNRTMGGTPVGQGTMPPPPVGQGTAFSTPVVQVTLPPTAK